MKFKTMYEVTEFIHHNDDKAVETLRNIKGINVVDLKDDMKEVKFNNSSIILFKSYNPYPSMMWNVM